jgi:replication factor A1
MKLEQGTVEVIYNNQGDNPLYDKPVLQITVHEKVGIPGEDKYRVRANLSDGQYYLKGIFSSVYTQHFDNETIKNNSLVRLSTFQLRRKNENYYLYVQEVDEYEDCNRRVGVPVNSSSKRASLSNETKARSVKEVVRPKMDLSSPKKVKSNHADTTPETIQITAISALNPFHNKWVIRGRVVTKSDIRHFTNQRGEGRLFSLEVADKTGQIKVACFSECVDIFYPMFEVGKVYTISKGSVKMANKQYSNSTSDYEIHLEKTSEVNMILDDHTPQYFFKFTKIGELALSTHLFDVVGVAKEVYPVTSVTIRSTQKEVSKRDIMLLDDTGSIRLTLWGQKASLDFGQTPIVAAKAVKVGEYNGLTLSTVVSSQVVINPEIAEAYELRGWYEKFGKDLKITAPRKEERRLIQEVRDGELEYSLILATVISVKEDSLWYDSCPGEGCNKKVVLEDNGMYRCERCNKSYDDKCNTR